MAPSPENSNYYQGAEKGVDGPKSSQLSYLRVRPFFAKSGFFSSLLASSAIVTLVTALPQGTETQKVRARNQRSVFRDLVVAGVRVLIHDTLRAKVYLFKKGDKVCWVVGSSNLTFGGLSGNTEMNVAGYRLADYREVLSQVEQIIDGAYPV